MRSRSFLPLLCLLVAAIASVACSAFGSGASSPNEANSAEPKLQVRVETLATPTPAATPTPLPDRASCADIKGTEYHSDTEQQFYLASCIVVEPVLVVRASPSPPAIPGRDVPGERWILIDLAKQEAMAMIGDQPLYKALVTTGKDGWETPTGNFRIQYRVMNETMTSASIGAEEYYVLKDVLYTQYFTSAGHALHLNYWRPDYYFGDIASSHGCVGMRLADAEFFWKFAANGTRVTIQNGA